MTLIIPTREQAHAGMRAMKTALSAAGAFDGPRREALESVQRHLFHTDFDIDVLLPIEPEALGREIVGRALREQLVNGMATLAMAGDRVDEREVVAIETFASALDVQPALVRQARLLSEQRIFLLRIDVLRRGPSKNALAEYYDKEGALAIAKGFLTMAGLMESPELAAKYHALEAYAEGTLGKELWRFYRSNGFHFPGERHGPPEPLLTHDLSHILAGYGTDMPGESQTLAFQAGYRRENPHGILAFLLVTAQHGIRVTPLAEASRNTLSTPGLVDAMVHAFARGNAMNTDLTEHWDYWAVMDRPVAMLREQYGIAESNEGGPART